MLGLMEPLLCVYLWLVRWLFPVVFSLVFSKPLAAAKDEKGMAVWVQPVSSWQEPLGHPLILGSLSCLL